MGCLLLADMFLAAFVGVNIGGSSTGVAFGPALGANAVTRVGAGALIRLSAVGGGWTVGRNVVTTVGSEIVSTSALSLSAGFVVLICVGATLTTFLSSIGIPASLALSAIAAVIGLGWGRTRRGKSRAAPPLPATREETDRCDTSPSYAVHPSAGTLLQGSTVARVLAVWMVSPAAAGCGALAVTTVAL